MMKNMLDGVRVLDFSANAAGPCSAAMFADYGAYVVKIEKPKVGNDERAYGIQVENVSLLGAWLNRGKKSITLNLKDPEAIELIKKMIADYDILIESGRPGNMDQLGLGYDVIHSLNPRLVYCSVSAFGQEGPYAKKPGYDIIAQAMSGIMHITGEKDGPPMKSGTILSDYVGSINAFGSIMAAMYYARETGIGQHVDVSLLLGMIFINGSVEYLNVGLDLGRSGNHQNNASPYGLFEGKNGQSLIIAVVSQRLWGILCGIMGRPDMINDSKFFNQNARRENRFELIRIIEDWLKTFDDIQIPADMLNKAGIPSCRVLDNKGVVGDVHMKDQRYFVDVPTPKNVTQMDKFFARNCIAKFSETPGTIRQAPVVGENNYEVLGQYGLSKEDVDRLQAKWDA